MLDIGIIIINAGLLAVGLVAAVAAIVQARAATRDRKDSQVAAKAAEDARDEARVLAEKANAAFVRQAEALERANELEEAKQPKSGYHFHTVYVAGDTYAIVCDDLTADDVILSGVGPAGRRIIPMEETPRSLAKGDSMRFMVAKATFGSGAGSSPRLRLDFVKPDTGEADFLEMDLTI